MGRFYNCGQACLAIKRLYVFESVADEVIEAVAAKAARLRVGIGSRSRQPARPAAHRGPARASWSARSPRAGERSSPAAGAPRASTAAGSTSRRSSSSPAATRRWRTEEVFGPALPIWRVKDMDEAIELANDSPFGLGSSRLDARPRPRRARRRRARLRLHVDQLAHEGLRRAALRRPEGLGLRQGARLRGAGLLHGPEVGRRQARAVACAAWMPCSGATVRRLDRTRDGALRRAQRLHRLRGAAALVGDRSRGLLARGGRLLRGRHPGRARARLTRDARRRVVPRRDAQLRVAHPPRQRRGRGRRALAVARAVRADAPPSCASWSRNAQARLRELGVTKGDRVVAYLPNIPETLVCVPGHREPRRDLGQRVARVRRRAA